MSEDLVQRIEELEALLAQRDTEIADLKAELSLTDKLLEDSRAIIKLIPPCPQHGDECLPNARQWIEMNKRARAFSDGIQLAPLWRTHK